LLDPTRLSSRNAPSSTAAIADDRRACSVRPRSSQTREPRRPNNLAAQELLGPWQPPPFAILIVLQPIRESLEAEPIGGLK
jgi:hypothetical protein